MPSSQWRLLFRRWLLVAAMIAPGVSLNVAVTGATGRVGRLVVQRLLQEGHAVTALVRDVQKATETLSIPSSSIREVDLGTADADSIRAACQGADRLIWCASGFSDAGQSIDLRGMAEVPSTFVSAASGECPAIVMLSSAGVTRTVWNEAKKERLMGAADIPIIRLNPGGILDKKRKAHGSNLWPSPPRHGRLVRSVSMCE